MRKIENYRALKYSALTEIERKCNLYCETYLKIFVKVVSWYMTYYICFKLEQIMPHDSFDVVVQLWIISGVPASYQF